jgi:hypothetical protein
MKDLLVFVADADAQAFMRGILEKPKALGIRSISFDIDRHPLKDPGMVQTGPELTRMKKEDYQKVLLMFDFHGSGRDHRETYGELREQMQARLDSLTWTGNSSVAVLVPELECWCWFCENAMRRHYKITENNMVQWTSQQAKRLGMSVDDLKLQQPKELFEYVVKGCLRRTISPRDFHEIGRLASIRALLACDSFQSIFSALRGWFPS